MILVRFFLLTFLINAFSFSSKGQIVDSLLNKLTLLKGENSAEELDTKSILCNTIAIHYQDNSNGNKARFYFLQSLYFAIERIEIDHKWDAQNNYDIYYLYKNLAVFESTLGNEEQSNKYIDKAAFYFERLKLLLPPLEYDWLLIRFYETRFVLCYHFKKFEDGKYYNKKIEELILKLGQDTEYLLAKNMRELGELYSKEGKKVEAEEILVQALHKAEELPDSMGLNIDQFIHSVITVKYYNEKYNEVIDFLNNRTNYRTFTEVEKYAKSGRITGMPTFLNTIMARAYALLHIHEESTNLSYLQESYKWQGLAFSIAEYFTLKNNAEKMDANMSGAKGKVLGILKTAAALSDEGLLKVKNIFEILRIIDVYHSSRLHLERVSYDMNAVLWKQQKELKNQLNYVNLKIKEYKEEAVTNEIIIDSLRGVAYEYSMQLVELDKSTKKEKILEEYKVGQEGFKSLFESYVKRSDKNSITYFHHSDLDSVFIIGVNADTSFILGIPVSPNLVVEINELYDLNAHLQFSDRKIKRQKELNALFYTYFFKPILPFLNSDNILIYPINEMSYISFDALLDDENEYLVNSYSFQYTSSLFSIINPEKKQEKKQDLISFYPTNYGTDSLALLFNAKKEVDEIQLILNGTNYEKEHASKTTFLKKTDSTKILHLATHSILNFDNPYESYILFDASEDSVDNQLFAYEIFSMLLNNDLVILSSCNSANGNIEEGIGVVSLSNALYFAGVASTISSLWSAQDKSSSTIMIDFYKNLYEGKSKSESLRQAKKNYLEKADKIKNQPFFWANYVVYGDDSPLFEKPERNKSWINYLIGIGLVLVLFFVGKKFFYSKSPSKA